MLWLFTQIWIWIIVALLLGVLAGWWFWARPLHRAADAIEAGSTGRPRPRCRPPAALPGHAFLWRTFLVSWLYVQTWLWYLIAFVVGIALAWVLLVVPQQRRLRTLRGRAPATTRDTLAPPAEPRGHRRAGCRDRFGRAAGDACDTKAAEDKQAEPTTRTATDRHLSDAAIACLR